MKLKKIKWANVMLVVWALLFISSWVYVINKNNNDRIQENEILINEVSRLNDEIVRITSEKNELNSVVFELRYKLYEAEETIKELDGN